MLEDSAEEVYQRLQRKTKRIVSGEGMVNEVLAGRVEMLLLMVDERSKGRDFSELLSRRGVDAVRGRTEDDGHTFCTDLLRRPSRESLAVESCERDESHRCDLWSSLRWRVELSVVCVFEAGQDISRVSSRSLVEKKKKVGKSAGLAIKA